MRQDNEKSIPAIVQIQSILLLKIQQKVVHGKAKKKPQGKGEEPILEGIVIKVLQITLFQYAVSHLIVVIILPFWTGTRAHGYHRKAPDIAHLGSQIP